ncbi:hypothetical protein C8Q80DRAFT_1146733 [Daedaleopsis nitida]|nr:hypothetical protein C8Q80DRAFT_1146733 [Daedaleopsis nitida]
MGNDKNLLDRLPIELLETIFSLACSQDGGRTGRSLALVSKSVHAASRAARFTSVSLSSSSPDQLRQFLACFTAERERAQSAGCTTPAVRHLFLARAERKGKLDTVPRAGEADPEQEEYERDVSALFDLVARDLRTLFVLNATVYTLEALNLPAFGARVYPRLQELHIFGGCAGFPHASPLPSLSRLTHLHIVRGGAMGALPQWAACAPGLTHVNLSNLDHWDAQFVNDLGYSTGVEAVNGASGDRPPSFEQLESLALQLSQAPRKGRICGSASKLCYIDFAADLRRVHQNSTLEWALLPPVPRPSTAAYQQLATAEWTEWSEGRAGCWTQPESGCFNKSVVASM